MNANQFAIALGSLTRSDQELRALGYSDQLIDRERERYKCAPRFPVVPHQSDPLLDLLTRYDCSKVQVGGIHFLGQPEDLDGCWLIGTEELDGIVIDKPSGEVLLLEYNSDYVMSECAQSSSKFLDALVICATVLSLQAKHKNMAMRHNMAEQCARSAGGQPYLNFYMNMLGCE